MTANSAVRTISAGKPRMARGGTSRRFPNLPPQDLGQRSVHLPAAREPDSDRFECFRDHSHLHLHPRLGGEVSWVMDMAAAELLQHNSRRGYNPMSEVRPDTLTAMQLQYDEMMDGRMHTSSIPPDVEPATPCESTE